MSVSLECVWFQTLAHRAHWPGQTFYKAFRGYLTKHSPNQELSVMKAELNCYSKKMAKIKAHGVMSEMRGGRMSVAVD